MCSDIAVAVSGVVAGNVFAGMPVATDNAIVASGGDVYAYSAGVTSRTNGKMYFVLVFQKTV